MSNILILRAAKFAADKHKNQRRKDKETSPYINHPISVALIISEVGRVNDSEILAAALLHDTLEDTKTTPEELELNFGANILSLVREVTDNKDLPKETRKLKQIEHAKELSSGAVLIKLADKIANVQDVTSNPPKEWTIERRNKYLDWAENVIANCPPVNSFLEKYFAKTIEEGRKILKSNRG